MYEECIQLFSAIGSMADQHSFSKCTAEEQIHKLTAYASTSCTVVLLLEIHQQISIT